MGSRCDAGAVPPLYVGWPGSTATRSHRPGEGEPGGLGDEVPPRARKPARARRARGLMPSALPRPGADLTRAPPTSRVAFVVLGHGSREAAANEELERFVDAWRAHRGPCARVAHAYVELARPSLDDALDAAARGADEVVVVPLLLFAAGHVKNDVPLALSRARRRF